MTIGTTLIEKRLPTTIFMISVVPFGKLDF